MQQTFNKPARFSTLFLVALLSIPQAAVSEQGDAAGMDQVMAQIREAQIAAHVPSNAQFDSLLRRDLTNYFEGTETGGELQLDYQLLRETPTQSGIAHPKFYLWAQARSGDQVIKLGALRVAAIDRQRFEVHQFLSAATIRQDPQSAAEIFPKALLGNIYELAGAEQ